MEGECRVVLEQGPATAQVEAELTKLPGRSYRPMWIASVVAIALCFSVAVFFTWHGKNQHHPQMADDLRHTLRQISGNARAAIHLEGVHNESLKDTVEWEEGVNQYHSQGGLELRDNEIVIPRHGLYFVYSQASFRVSCHLDRNEDSDEDIKHLVHLSHSVKRWSRSYSSDDSRRRYETILHSVRTTCEKTASNDPDQDGKWFSSVYMGAVFNLHAGDRLQTRMERLDDLDEHPGSTFFGAFAL